jgi:hypothetical protein
VIKLEMTRSRVISSISGADFSTAFAALQDIFVRCVSGFPRGLPLTQQVSV